MQAVFDFILHALAELPNWLAAVFVGWFISVGLTQSIKFLVPVSVYHGYREQLCRLIAILTASLPSGWWYAAHGGDGADLVLVTMGSGVWSPLAFAMLQAVLKRWWPWAADVLSQDIRNGEGARP